MGVTALAPDTLVLGDRLYGTAAFFDALHTQRCWGLVRRNRQLPPQKHRRFRKRRHADGVLEDWLVRAGTGGSAPSMRADRSGPPDPGILDNRRLDCRSRRAGAWPRGNRAIWLSVGASYRLMPHQSAWLWSCLWPRALKRLNSASRRRG
jgi:hypothetical protein